ncbi:MAG: PDZ domain-containing protein, partial [Limnohabitans sp.]
DGPAARAGLRPGDVIAQVNRQPVRNVPELLARVAALAPGKAARLQVLRRSGATEIEITPGQRPSPRTMRQAR